MKYLYLIPIVLILIISNIGSIYAQEDLKQEEASAGDILLFIKGKGLLELPKYLKENKKIFQDKLTIDMFFNVFYQDYE